MGSNQEKKQRADTTNKAKTLNTLTFQGAIENYRNIEKIND